MRKCAAFVVLAFLGLGAGAQIPEPADVWFTAGHIALTATGADSGLAAEWQFDRADNGDVRLVKNERRGTVKVSGTVTEVVGGNAMLDSVAITKPLNFATLGEVRERIGCWRDPDVKVPKRADCGLGAA